MTFKSWDKIDIKTDDGETVKAIAPIIISASRSTDIPAFHANWFMNRLNAGYVKWINPFNRVAQYVSFEKTRIIVFWTKNAKPILPFLKEIDRIGLNYYFQFTLNDYEKEGLEPSVPSINDRIESFKDLSKKIGKEKVIWRFDPLILTKKTSVEDLLEKIHRIGTEIHDYTDKLVISFADIETYAKVKRNLTKAGIEYTDFDKESMIEIAEGIQKMNEEWGLKVGTCAESLNLNRYNIVHNKCIDDDLMMKIFRRDERLMDFLGVAEKKKTKQADFSAFVTDFESKTPRIDLKDKGQRKECGCIVSKDIGQYNTCAHLCIYCYANYSKNVVMNNLNKLNEHSETIV